MPTATSKKFINVSRHMNAPNCYHLKQHGQAHSGHGDPAAMVRSARQLVLWSQAFVFIAFFKPSFDLDYQMNLEEIVAIIAISTFVVGFSSVRLQSILEERKESTARRIDRVLEQNAGKDLLPLPSALGEMDATNNQTFADTTTLLTILLTWINFGVATLLILLHEASSAVTSFPLWSVQFVHFGIVLIGSFGPIFAKRQFTTYAKRQPFECYKKMMVEVQRNLDKQSEDKTLRQTINDFDASLPEWSWLTLIRCSVLQESNNEQVKRIKNLADPQKDRDIYSLIAFVWSAYLLDDGEHTSISRTVQFADIAKIIEFGCLKSSLTLVQVAPAELPDKLVTNFLDLKFHKEQPANDDASRLPKIYAETYARLTVREIKRVWGPSPDQLVPGAELPGANLSRRG